MKYVGNLADLIDITKMYKDYKIYENPNEKEFFDICNFNIYNTEHIFVLFSIKDEHKFSITKEMENLPNIILLFDSLYYNYEENLTKEHLLNLIYNYLNLDNGDEELNRNLISLSKYESLFNIVYKYSILQNLDLLKKNIYYKQTDTIKFFRSTLYKINNWSRFPELGKYSTGKQELLKCMLYRLEFSFKKTGLYDLSVYFNIILNVLNHEEKN
jgi:hypothetical protein